MDYYAIGQRVRKFRKAQGLSQEELAERVGISTTHMSHIETGNTKLSLPVFVDLASVLEVRADDLLYDEQPLVRCAGVEEVVRILEACTTQELRIMKDILRATKLSLNKYL